MSKSTVTRLFIVAIVTFVAAWILVIIAAGLAFAQGAIVFGGPDVVTLNAGAFAPTTAVLVIAAIVGAIGTILGVLSWIGALLTTAQLEDKTWFVLLLLLGLWNFGVVAMIAYVIAGPDPARQGAPAHSVATTSGP